MYCYLIILLRITKYNQTINQKSQKHISYYGIQIGCIKYESINFDYCNEEIAEGSYYYCSGNDNSVLQFFNCSFSNVKMIDYRYSYFIHSVDVNLDIQLCNFYCIEYNSVLIFYDIVFFTIISNCIFKMHSNNISYCNKNGGMGNIIYSHSFKNDIQNNYIYFDPNIETGRGFYFEYHTNLIFNNNHVTNAKYSQGSGVYFNKKGDGKEELQISGCVFTNCIGEYDGGTFYLPDASYNLNFENMIFEQIKNRYDKDSGYMIKIMSTNGKPELTFTGCKFSFIETNSKTGSGIGLWFMNDNNYNISQKLKFDGTIFEHICYDNCDIGGGAISINLQSVGGESNVEVIGCTFTNISSKKCGGAIYFNSEKNQISIKNSTFDRTNSKEDGNAVYIAQTNENLLEITSCCFIDCGSNLETYSIQIYPYNFDFIDNKVIFSDPAKSCGCINVNQISKDRFIGNMFQNAFRDSNVDSSGININWNGNSDIIEIVNNTFDCLLGNAEGRCFFVNFGNDIKNFVVKNNVIQNCPIGGILVRIVLNSQFKTFEISDFSFINNTFDESANSIECICPQIKITFPFGSPINLDFVNCYFISNYHNKDGGGISYAGSQINKNGTFVFNQCHFINNMAKGKGSAIAILTSIDCKINQCEFIRNRCEEGAGAIYIETKYAKLAYSNDYDHAVSINNCIFDNNEGENAGINADNSPNIQIEILNCSFINCGKEGYPVLISSNIDSILPRWNSRSERPVPPMHRDWVLQVPKRS